MAIRGALQAQTPAKLDERATILTEITGGMVPVVKIGEVVGAILQSAEPAEMDEIAKFAETGEMVQQEIQELVSFIEKARQEIASLQPQKMVQEDLPETHLELSAVVDATEDATNKILDIATELEILAGEVDGPTRDRLGDLTTRIYEASNFQDITGQRITKVTRTLNKIEAKLVSLANALGHELYVDITLPPEEEIDEDQALLHGPQLPDNACNQDDIDALLASFD